MSGEKKRRRKKGLDKMSDPDYNPHNATGHLLKQIARHAKGLELAAFRLAEHLETKKPSGSDRKDPHPPK